jgi:hypothetical protein
MKNLFLALMASLALPVAAHAQTAILPTGTAPAPASTQATTSTETTAATAVIAPAPETPAANPNALKVKAEVNPVTNRLTVRTDAPGPTRVEVNDVSGRPVITHNMMVGTNPAVLNVSQLPAGAYVVRCTAGERTGMRRVILGQ